MAISDKKREKEIIVRLRAVAVFCIVLAHCNALPENALDSAQIMMELCSSLSFFGVWVFFMLGGYLLAYEKRSFVEAIQRKIKTIVLPWFFTGALVYLYTEIRHGGVSVKALLQFVMGYGSYLWYMSVFAGLLILFLIGRSIKLAPYGIIMIALLIELTGIQYRGAGTDYKLYYVLCGAWPIACALGFLINRKQIGKKIYLFSKRYGVVWTSASLIAILSFYAFFGRWYYWSKCYVLLCVLVVPSIMWITLFLEKRLGKVMDEIGGMSFSIYLLHMPVVGIVNNIFCRFDKGLSVPLRPFIVIAVTWLGVRLICFIGGKIKQREIVYALIGRR